MCMLFEHASHDIVGAIGGTIVDDDDLEILIGAVEQRFDGVADADFLVPGGNDHGDERCSVGMAPLQLLVFALQDPALPWRQEQGDGDAQQAGQHDDQKCQAHGQVKVRAWVVELDERPNDDGRPGIAESVQPEPAREGPPSAPPKRAGRSSRRRNHSSPTGVCQSRLSRFWSSYQSLPLLMPSCRTEPPSGRGMTAHRAP